MNLTLQEYQLASDLQKQGLINYIERVRPDLHFDSFLTDCLYPLPRFKFSRLKNMYFIYIPGGKFNMGLSEAEEWAAREIMYPLPMNIDEMRPVKEVNVESFLVSEIPFLQRHAWCMQAYVRLAPCETHHQIIERSPDYTLYTWIETALALAEAVNACLPNEYQREYFCRGNTNTLFCFGNALPDRTELNDWFNDKFDDLPNMRRNNFGISGLFMTEWCADFFRNDYTSDKASADTRVLRGGGADFFIRKSIFSDEDWGYFDNEGDWVWCVSAIRMPSTNLVDETAGFRLVINLNTSK